MIVRRNGLLLAGFLCIAAWPQIVVSQEVRSRSDEVSAWDESPGVVPHLTSQESGTTASLRGVCAVSDQVCWASGANGTCLRTTDGGKTWHKLEVPDAGEIDFRDVHAWSADRALLMGIVGPPRFFLTEDGGQTWREVYRNDSEGAFFDAVAFWDDKRGVAFGDPLKGRLALITTADGGTTWQGVERDNIAPAVTNEGGFAASGTCLAVGKNGLALIGLGGEVPEGKARVMRSDDYGKSWTAAESPMRAGVGAGIFSLCWLDEQRVVAVGGNYLEPEDMSHTAMFSTNAGRSWTLVEEDTPGGYRSAVAMVPNQGAKVLTACGPTGVDISHDAGQSWTLLSKDGYHAVSFAPGGTGWLTGADGRIARIAHVTFEQAPQE